LEHDQSDDHEKQKQQQIERQQKCMKRFRSLAERKALEQQSRERRAQRHEPKRARNDEDELEALGGSESMHRRGGGRATRVARPPRSGERHDAGGATNGRGAVPSGERALVIGLAPGRARVRFDDGGVECDAALAEAIARTQRASIAVGDRVFVRELARGTWRVEAVDERTSVLSRPDAARANVEHVIAANVDLAIVVATAAQPAFRPGLVDRYLVALESGGVAPFVVVNKSDLADADARVEIEDFVRELEAIGVAACLTSTTSGEGLERVRAATLGKMVVLVGQSGVGKSSLANALFSSIAESNGPLRTGRVRDGDGKGRHTTTSSHLFEVDERGTRVIDTPGVRSFGLAEATLAELERWFPEFDEHRAACRFSDCTHTHEPVCGVRAAAESGAIASRRYEAYLRIRES